MQMIFDVDEHSDMEELLACREWLADETGQDGVPADVSLDQVIRMLIRNWRKTAEHWKVLDDSDDDTNDTTST